jgi:S1-C subfamily serine protease
MASRTCVRCARLLALLLATTALASACAADPPAAVVGLTVAGCPPGEAHGSGAVVAPGLVLTAAHVVRGATGITLTNGSHTGPAHVVAFDPDMDLAYLATDTDFGSALPLGGSVERGSTGTAYVFRDGAPVALPVRVRRPVRIETEDIYIKGTTDRPGFELAAEIKPGDSGGPVVVDGRVIGVLWARSDKNSDRAYAIDPVAAGATVREQLRTGVIDDAIDLSRCT